MNSKMLLKGDGIDTRFEVTETNASDDKMLISLLEKLDLDAHSNGSTGKIGLGTSNILSMACELLLNRNIGKMWIILEKYFAIRRSENQFFDWTDDADDTSAYNDEDGEVSTSQNIFTYTSPISGRSVHIHLSSIHSEKGKTHLATLVLDTFWFDRNIPSIIPWLCNTPPKKKIQVRNAMRLKCQYVALSRARGLICMALRKDTITPEEQSDLSTLGWNIVEL